MLADAFAGRALPSARTVAGVVRVCDIDPGLWLDRRDRLANARREDFDTPEGDSGRRQRRRVPLWIVTAVAGFPVSTVACAAVAIPVFARQVPAAATPLVPVHTGDDAGRIKDSDVGTTHSGPANALLEIVWSDTCQAAWARITRYDGLDQENTVIAAIYPETSPNGGLRQEATEHDVNTGYTFFVVGPTPETLLCGDGSSPSLGRASTWVISAHELRSRFPA